MASLQENNKTHSDAIAVVPADQTSGGDDKLGRVVEISKIRVLGLSEEDEEFYTTFPATERKTMIHKIDIRLCPMLAMLYLISHLDRSNIGNANIEGMSEDLGLTGVQYNVALSILFVTYILFEIPSNMILKRFKRPSWYIAILVFSWGTIMTLTGVVQNYAGLIVCRLLLGLFEAGFFPGAIFLCSQWYMPHDLATRIAYLYNTSAIASAFSGLLAAAIAEMDGTAGYQGWRWIFILEGLATVVLGVICFFLLIDTPPLSPWLTEKEKKYLALEQFIKNGGGFGEQNKQSNWRVFLEVVADWKLWVMASFLLINSTAGYGLKFTMPAIVKGMGFKNRDAQLMTAPPYIAAAIATVISSKLSDRFYRRYPFVLGAWFLCIIGFSVILSYGDRTSENVGPSYFAVVLICLGLFPANPAMSSWTANNISPSSKRAVGIAFYSSVGGIGGIIASFIYLSWEAPGYKTGYGVSIAVLATGVILASSLEYIYTRRNKQREAMDPAEIREKYTEQELSNMGDKSPLFRYIL